MAKPISFILRILLIILLVPSTFFAQKDKERGMLPSNVVVSPVRSGSITPEAEFIGTVYYQEVSDVASEVNGSVESVMFEEGQRVKRGDVLVKLIADLLEKTLQANRALHEQTLTELEIAVINLGRIEVLHAEQLVPAKTFDEYRFQVKGLEKKAASLKAEVDRLELEIMKKTVKSPFSGVVVKRHVDRGEWLSPGAPVATIAKDDVVDIVVEVPEEVIKNVRPGMKVPVKSGGKKITGRVFQIIPSGDVATRVFPVKVRIQNSISLIEGMEARVNLPVGKSKQALIVNRDAVITKFGSSVVFAIIDSKAKMIQVKITGFRGLTVGVASSELTEGMNVVIKGNERLLDGQPVNISNTTQKTR